MDFPAISIQDQLVFEYELVEMGLLVPVIDSGGASMVVVECAYFV